MARVVVVGGGVIGVSCAYYLRARGAEVILLEREKLAAGASSGNAGTVSAGHPPLNRPGRMRKAIVQMMDPTSPLYVKPRWDPALWAWLVTFARHCTWEHVEACMNVMAPLGMDALALFDGLVDEEGLECGYTRDGYFDICRTEEGLAGARHEAEIIARHGYHPDSLSGDDLRKEEPALTDEVMGGVYFPEARTLDPNAFVLTLAARVAEQGVDVRTGVAVDDVVVAGGRATGLRLAGGGLVEADAVVLATGPFSLDLAAKLGTRLPVAPGKGYHRDLPVGSGSPPLRIAGVLNESSVFCTPMNGFVRYAGTMEFSGLNHVMREPRLDQLTRAARRYFSGFGDAAPLSEWCGLRPVAADGLPIVGSLPGAENVMVATGHGMLGLTLGPVTGRQVASEVFDGVPEPGAAALSPSRFRA
jgi:D-amino-acid dehydrogenase